MSGLSEVEDWIGQEWTFECGEDVNDVFEQINDDWGSERRERFDLVHVLGNDLPDFMVWLQGQIDDECEDITETITFTPERDERVKKLQEKIIDTEIELSIAREELADIEEAQIGLPEIGIIATIKSFIRNIYRG